MIELNIKTQPNDETCGATCLQAIYDYYGFNIALPDVIQGVKKSLSGGTLAPYLGQHALAHDFDATIYVNNLTVFDPSWFDRGMISRDKLQAKLLAQLKFKNDPDLVQLSEAYLAYLAAGGNVRFRMLSVKLLQSYFEQKIPIITGLSATYLYFNSREYYTEAGESIYDDIQGTPCGHFVVLCGYDDKKRRIVVADPHRENPISHRHFYTVSIHRLINAIMLGVITYDANLLIIQPKVN